MKWLFYSILCLFFVPLNAQEIYRVKGKVIDEKLLPLEFCTVVHTGSNKSYYTDQKGEFECQVNDLGIHTFLFMLNGYHSYTLTVNLPEETTAKHKIQLKPMNKDLEEVVVTGSLRETGKDESPVNIDIITPKLFQRTNTPTLMEAASMINGVRPQVNCNVCNTGDIHINGMEGPYTLVLIDGMPIVSGLSSVYGLSGIPIGMIERLEVMKGPASSLYGSEAMGGIINVITKKHNTSPRFFTDYSITSYLENNLDLSTTTNLGKKTHLLIGSNAFWYNTVKDINNDEFTDVTLQKRISLFSKLNIERSSNKQFSIGARWLFEDRWGGQTNWTKHFKGSDSIYGETIETQRAELIANYEWPLREKIMTQLSYNYHVQNSYYGQTSFDAIQNTGFIQTYWDKSINSRNKLLIGASLKHLYYDDNTPVTQIDSVSNRPEYTMTKGLFTQWETTFGKKDNATLLTGIRLDHHPIYKFITSPRIAFKWTPHYRVITRLNLGSGFRIVNVFTEDHAALTGARDVVFTEKIEPETSYNGSLNIIYKMPFLRTRVITLDLNGFYYHFTNKIIANYDIDPNKVIYANLSGYAYTRGGSLNVHYISNGNLKLNIGATYTEVYNINVDSIDHQLRTWQLNTPKFTGTYLISYTINKLQLKFDLNGTVTGPQRLAILPKDFRPEFSPWYTILNLQVSKELKNGSELYIGAKNLLNFIPQHPIMRPFDPFDKTASDATTNPNGYTFDPSYNYAPVQGLRGYMGFRLYIK